MAKVSEDEIEQLKLTQKDPESLATTDYMRPGVGETVTVVEGAFQGLTGEVIEHRGRLSLLVRVQSIRQTVKVQVSAEAVERSQTSTVDF